MVADAIEQDEEAINQALMEDRIKEPSLPSPKAINQALMEDRIKKPSLSSPMAAVAADAAPSSDRIETLQGGIEAVSALANSLEVVVADEFDSENPLPLAEKVFVPPSFRFLLISLMFLCWNCLRY